MIRLQFVLGHGLSSGLIGWFGLGKKGYSHVDAILPSGNLLGARSDAIGGQPPGVHVRSPNYEKWLKQTVVEIECTDEQASKWLKYLLSQIGDPYDKKAIEGFIEGTYKHTPGSKICSALQFLGLKKQGIIKETDVQASEITPNSLYLIVTAGLGGKITNVIAKGQIE